MSCGIAHLDADSAPSPLPVQALDHASGYFLAAAVCRALADLVRTGVPSDIRTSLVATANRLMELPVPAGPGRTDPDWPDELFEAVPTAWGPARRVRVPGTVDGVVPVWSIEAGPLGRHEAAFG
jgi:crotonobetainyl-CoA:carnitine CoA-transferase CaiB-like acyl-CoA transferase